MAVGVVDEDLMDLDRWVGYGLKHADSLPDRADRPLPRRRARAADE
jgi:hypothetical protein